MHTIIKKLMDQTHFMIDDCEHYPTVKFWEFTALYIISHHECIEEKITSWFTDFMAGKP